MSFIDALVGRDAELAKLEYAIAQAELGAGRLVLLSGEPGIGKSRLADESARRAQSHGFLVSWGRSWEAEGTPAYWPWIEALETIVAAPVLGDVVAAARVEAPELHALLQSGGAPGGERDGKGAGFRLARAVARLLGAAASKRPLFLVLDDLHVADTASLELTSFVARALRAARVVCVATTRDASFVPPPSAERLALLSDIAREAMCIELRGLSREAVVEWVQRDAPALADGERGQRVFESSSGNPLFVRELIAGGLSSPEPRSLPLGIAGAIRAHLERVSPLTRRALEIASVLGRDLRFDVLRAMVADAGVDRASLDACLEEALGCAIITPDGEGRARFVHALLRDELYARLTPQERAALHRAAARRFATDAGQASSAAHHALFGVDAGSAGATTAIVLRAMAESSARLAFADAAALGLRARAVLGGWAPAASDSALLTAIGEAQIHGGAHDEGQRSCLLASERAEASGDGVALARAALAYALEQKLGRQPDSAALLRRALAALDDHERSLRARVLARLAAALVPPLPDDEEQPLVLAREALRLAREAGDDETRLAVFTMLGTTFPEEFTVEERFSLNGEAIALAERLGQVAAVALLFAWQVACWLELGHLDGAKQELSFAEKSLASLPSHYRWRGELLRAMLLVFEGKFDEAGAISRRVLEDPESPPLGTLHASIQLMALPHVRGDEGDYAALDPTIARIHRKTPGSELFMSIADATCGRFERVRETMARARTLDLSGVPGVEHLGWPLLRAGLAEHAGYFYEITRARSATGVLMLGPGALISFGPRDLLAGRLALLDGRVDLARQHLERALAFCMRLGAPPFLAHTELALAESAAASGQPERVKVHAAAARKIAEAVEMRTVAARAAALLDEASAATGTRPEERAETVSTRAARPEPVCTFVIERRGELWALGAGGCEILLKDARGLAYLEVLVRAPHRDVHVLELMAAGAGEGGEARDAGDAGPVLDEKAKRVYRERAAELRERLDEAERFGDGARAGAARAELEALGAELARAVGLGGRDKRAASVAERARINVQRRLRDVIKRAADADAAIGRHLESSVKTGVFCRYAPTWPPLER